MQGKDRKGQYHPEAQGPRARWLLGARGISHTTELDDVGGTYYIAVTSTVLSGVFVVMGTEHTRWFNLETPPQ